MATELNLGAVDLNDGINYELLQGWVPRVAKRRRSVMGGGGPYEDVVENIPVRVFDSTAALCLAAAERIVEEMDQANIWARGGIGTGDVILLKYLPDGTSLAEELEAVCLGTPDNAPDMLTLPPEYDTSLAEFQLHVNIPLIRRGAWLGAEISATAATTGRMAEKITANFSGSGVDFPSPTDVTLAPSSGGFEEEEEEIILLMSGGGTGRFHITEAEDIDSGDFVTRGWAGASEDYYTRYTAPDTAENAIDDTSISMGDTRRVGFFSMLRSNTSDYSFLVRIRVSFDEGLTRHYTRWTTVDTSSQTPRPIFFGSISVPDGASVESVGIAVKAESASTELDIDYIVTMDMDNAHALYLEYYSAEGSVTFDTIEIEHRANSAMTPRVFMGQASGTVEQDRPYRGDAYISMTGGSITAVILYPDTANSKFRTQSSTSTTRVLWSVTGKRRPAYLVPR